MENIKRILLVVLVLVIVFCFSSCEMIYISNNDKKSLENVASELFMALDNGDEDAIYNLFSSEVRNKCYDLKEQIALLVSLYSGPTDEFKIGPSQTSEHFAGKQSWKSTNTVIPVRSSEEYFWFHIELMYENYNEDKIGVTQLDFCTIDEEFTMDKKIDREGLYLHTEKVLDYEICVINSKPCRYTNVNRIIDLDDVKKFIKTSKSFNDFVSHFGKPNAENIFYYYELPKENGEPRYLRISEDNGEIYSMSLVDDFEFVEEVWKSKD